MNELTNSEKAGGLSLVDSLAREARYYSEQTGFNMLQLGRVLREAKPLIEYGKWLDWVTENAGLDVRGAQYCIACYETYGLDPDKAKLGQSKLRAMLPMSEEEREKLLKEKDVSAMSVRELKDEVKKKVQAAREEEQEKAREAVAAEKENAVRMAESAARKARAEAAEELEAMRAELSENREAAEELRKRAEMAESQVQDAMEAAREAGKNISAKAATLQAEEERIRQELKDKDELIKELQEQYDDVNQKYLDAQSTIVRGDADRSTADILSAEAIHASVRDFLDQNSRLPYMHTTFAAMGNKEHESIRADMLLMQDFLSKVFRAMDAINGNGGIVE